MRGIVSWGAYLPYRRLDRGLISTFLGQGGGRGTRTVASGIAKYYKPEEMVGRTVVLVCNLKPVKLRGVLSEGMILCAGDDEGNLNLVGPEGLLPDGSEVR